MIIFTNERYSINKIESCLWNKQLVCKYICVNCACFAENNNNIFSGTQTGWSHIYSTNEDFICLIIWLFLFKNSKIMPTVNSPNAPDWDVGAWMGTSHVPCSWSSLSRYEAWLWLVLVLVVTQEVFECVLYSLFAEPEFHVDCRFYPWNMQDEEAVHCHERPGGMCGQVAEWWSPLLLLITDICACQTISQFGGVVCTRYFLPLPFYHIGMSTAFPNGTSNLGNELKLKPKFVWLPLFPNLHDTTLPPHRTSFITSTLNTDSFCSCLHRFPHHIDYTLIPAPLGRSWSCGYTLS
jgi:hypothetical protein